MGGVEILVQPGDPAIDDPADDGAGQAHQSAVVRALSLQHMLLDEAAGKDVELALGIGAVLDPRDHAGQRRGGLLGCDDRLVAVVPDLGVGSEAGLHRLYVAGLDRVEEALGHRPDIVLFCHHRLPIVS